MQCILTEEVAPFQQRYWLWRTPSVVSGHLPFTPMTPVWSARRRQLSCLDSDRRRCDVCRNGRSLDVNNSTVPITASTVLHTHQRLRRHAGRFYAINTVIIRIYRVSRTALIAARRQCGLGFASHDCNRSVGRNDTEKSIVGEERTEASRAIDRPQLAASPLGPCTPSLKGHRMQPIASDVHK